jgi:glyoxylase-like metal-dependent hydrolase (beta-lactamase superfamily II)
MILPMPITRRHFLATSTATIAAGTFGRLTLFGQPAFAPAALRRGRQAAAAVTPVFKEIRRHVGYWTARGGTIGWLVNPAGAVAVDSQFPDTAVLCVEQLLKSSGKSDIATLINTHHHGDHTAGNGVFRPRTKQIIGHANVPKYMKATFDQAMARRAQQNPAPTTPAPTEPVVPDKTLTDALAFDHGDERVSVKHYGPAHTGGDVVILFEKANVAHMGDLMFNRAHPVIDRPNGASIANWTAVLQKVVGELPADTIYIFGHVGEKYPVTGNRADLNHHANYLTALLEYVRAQVKAGKTRDQVVGSTDTIKGFEDYGPLISRPLGPAFDEVAATGL